MKNSKIKSTENWHFTAVKNRCILHGRVFVMSKHVGMMIVALAQAFIITQIYPYLYIFYRLTKYVSVWPYNVS